MSTQPNYSGGMSPQTKTALFVGAGVLVLGIFAFILLRRKDPQNETNGNGQQEDNTSNTGGGDNQSNTTNPTPTPTPPPVETAPLPYDPTAEIRQLKDAMDGVGTSVKKIQQVIDRTTKEQRRIIQRTWDSQLSKHGGETLMEWIDGEFHFDWFGSDEQDAIIDAFYGN
tara:strand:- start:496 stop:1002 length:507 start_codon:yes stop_codon:yes gene_type:complete